MTDFGTRLKDLRIGHGLTQEEAADMIFVSKQAISKWENGHGLPDVACLGKLAELYGVSIDYLLTGKEIEKEVEIIEVEKEKIVEVEKPLTKGMIHSLLLNYQRRFMSSYGWICMSPIFIILGCIMIALYFKFDFVLGIGIIWIIFGIIILCFGVYRRKKCDELKKEIEEKTGRSVGLFGYKNKDRN